jgi:hypothetical protein
MPKIMQNTYINVRTREEYGALMEELDEQGFVWLHNDKIDEFDGFQFGEETVICCELFTFDNAWQFPEKSISYGNTTDLKGIQHLNIIPYSEWVKGETV